MISRGTTASSLEAESCPALLTNRPFEGGIRCGSGPTRISPVTLDSIRAVYFRTGQGASLGPSGSARSSAPGWMIDAQALHGQAGHPDGGRDPLDVEKSSLPSPGHGPGRMPRNGQVELPPRQRPRRPEGSATDFREVEGEGPRAAIATSALAPTASIEARSVAKYHGHPLDRRRRMPGRLGSGRLPRRGRAPGSVDPLTVLRLSFGEASMRRPRAPRFAKFGPPRATIQFRPAPLPGRQVPNFARQFDAQARTTRLATRMKRSASRIHRRSPSRDCPTPFLAKYPFAALMSKGDRPGEAASFSGFASIKED